MTKRLSVKYVVVLSLIAVLNACSGGDNNSSMTQEAAVFAFDKDAVTIDTITGQSGSETVSVRNTGTASGRYEVNFANVPWLSVSPANGTIEPGASQALTADYSCSAIGMSSTKLDVYVDSSKVLDSLQVTLNCEAPPAPKLSNVAPDMLSLSVQINQSARGEFSFSNTGDLDLTYELETNGEWLQLNVDQAGTLGAGDSSRATVAATCGNTVESRAGTVSIRSNDPENPLQSVNILLNCVEESTAEISDRLPPAIMEPNVRTGANVVRTFGFTNEGTGILRYELSTNAPFISIQSSVNGALDAGQAASVDVLLACGDTEETRTGTLIIESTDEDEARVEYNIELQCRIVPGPALSGLSPASLSLSAQLDNAVTTQFSFMNDGNEVLTWSAAPSANWLTIEGIAAGSLTPGDSQTVSITAACGTVTEIRSGRIDLSTNDPSPANASLPVTLSCGGSGNLSLSRMYITQAVPSFDTLFMPAARIPLVAGRAALFRAFVASPENLSGTVKLFSRVNGGPPTTLDIIGPAQAPATPSEGALETTYNILVPGESIVPGVEFYVQIDSDNVVNETNEADNRYPNDGWTPLDVRPQQPLRIRFVPVDINNGRTPVNVDASAYLAKARMLLPVAQFVGDVRQTPYVFNGDYESPCQLLAGLAGLRTSDGFGPADQVLYYGLVSNGQSRGFIGCGFVGGPISAGKSIEDLGALAAQETFAHEVGHNTSLNHAPCGEPANPDPNFPYREADIGSWGYNIVDGSVYAPQSQVKDFMSYCDPTWISDYHFAKARNFIGLSNGQQPASFATSQSWLVQGRIEGGRATITAWVPLARPAAVTKPGDYELVIFDERGTEAGRISFGVQEVSHGDAEIFSILVPQTTAPPILAEVRKQGVMLAEKRARALPDRSPGDPSSAVDARARREASGQVLVQWDTARFDSAAIFDSDTDQLVTIDDTGTVRFRTSANRVNIDLAYGFATIRRELAID